MTKTIFITGGAGFIGSHVVRRFVTKYPDYKVINLDALTYAGNLANLEDIASKPNYKFEKVDITDFESLKRLFAEYRPDGVVHLAAESHVDRSITDPFVFIRTNVLGTCNLLHCAKELWKDSPEGKRFYHVSTDEVYGALEFDGTFFTESTRYDPHSPYSASKASSDHFVRAFHDTYGLPIVISNCSNNYGSHHFPEKLIPLAINNIKLYPSTARAKTFATGCSSKTTLPLSIPYSTEVKTAIRTISVATTNGKISTLYVFFAILWTENSLARKAKAGNS